MINYLKQIKDDKEKLLEFCEVIFMGRMAERIKIALDMIDVAVEKGWEYAKNKYSSKITTFTKEDKSTNLFSFG